MGAPEKSQSNANPMQRVKVYRLSDDGRWDDQGTGHVTVNYLERSEDLGLFVIDEEVNDTLLMHHISPEDIYRKQEDTIISWRDPGNSTELAISFQETAGCSYIWDQICTVQRNLHFNSLNNETFHNMNSELRELPVVELSTLPLILKIVTESGIADQMRLTDLILKDQDFFRKLMDVFRICEDLGNSDGLHMIFSIVKGLILLNSPQIFEKIFGDELVMDIIGSLEYDPEAPRTQHHRNFLKEHVVFKEAIPIKDPRVLSKIHQTYRVGYVKDVVLARVLDEATVANLNSMIHANNATVVSLLKDDSTFIQELFARLKSPGISTESEKNLVHFLHEFCCLSKSLPVVQQLRFFRDLINQGIFDILSDVLQSHDKKLVLTGTDILILFLNQDPNLLRSYIVRQEGIPLLGLLVKGMLTDFGDNMHCQFLEILRTLLDAYTPSVTQRENIIDIFYEKHLCQLMDVITASCPERPAIKSEGNNGGAGDFNGTKPEILLNICELMCFCVLHHPFRIKSNFLDSNVIQRVLLLTRRREKYLVVAAIRFVRTLLSRHDEHLLNYIVKLNLLKSIVDVFVANGDRYNLLNSSVLELLEYIRKENIKLLLKYIVDTFWNQLLKFEHLTSIQAFKLKYDQCLESSGPNSNVIAIDPRKRIDERALEKEEEDYFNEDSDEEDTASVSHTQKEQAEPHLSNGASVSPASSSSRSGGLVDYADDEDDDDYRPPPRKQPESSEEDEDMMESLKVKRKIAPKEKEVVDSKKQRLGKNSKSKDNVFAALCSTLSQAVLPGKKNTNTPFEARSGSAKSPSEENHQESDSTSSRTCDDSEAEEGNHKAQEPKASASKTSTDFAHFVADDKKHDGEDSPLVLPTSSSEMAVNGS